MNNTPKPVTIITGFLGAGKTTLLNKIIQSNPSTNFLIIENEAAALNIDREFIYEADGNKVFELSNGCICCSLNTELGTLLNSIIISNIEYDYLLIEATGMADPGHLINMFSGRRTQKYFKLDGVVSLVDSSSFLKRLNEHYEVRKQIALSDILLVNKTDLVEPDKLSKIEQQLSTINPFARIEKTKYSKADTIQILNCNLFHPSNVEKSLDNLDKLSSISPVREHAHKIETISITIQGDFEVQKLSAWLDIFLFANPGNILRIKGIISVEGIQHKLALHSVGDNFQISQGNYWEENEERESRIVFIGSNLDKNLIEKNLSSVVKKPDKIES